jgi:two-component system sensor histidine kinase BaeS
VARGFAELVRRENAGLACNDDLSVVLDELAKLEHISARLLRIAQSEDAPLQMQTVDLRALLVRTARRWQTGAPERAWSVDCPELEAAVDPGRLEIALDSIVENAVRHTAPGGNVTLRGRASATEILLEVADDGTGIAEHDLPLIFEGFHSAGPHAGTGLGLAIVAAVAEAHHGRVAARNGADHGAVISMGLPRSAASAA